MSEYPHVEKTFLDLQRAFAEAWPDAEFVQGVLAQLPWGHNLMLLRNLLIRQEKSNAFVIPAKAGIQQKNIPRSGQTLLETDDDRLAYVIRLPVHPLAQQPAEQVTGEVTGEVERLMRALVGEMSRQQIQQALDLKHEDHFRNAYLTPALEAKVVEMTLPDKPRSSKQRYRLTDQGRDWLKANRKEGAP